MYINKYRINDEEPIQVLTHDQMCAAEPCEAKTTQHTGTSQTSEISAMPSSNKSMQEISSQKPKAHIYNAAQLKKHSNNAIGSANPKMSLGLHVRVAELQTVIMCNTQCKCALLFGNKLLNHDTRALKHEQIFVKFEQCNIN